MAAVTFPELVPPSAESLLADAPAAVVEAELRRLMEDWTTGLEVLGNIFDSSLASGYGAHSDGGAPGNGIGSENGKGTGDGDDGGGGGDVEGLVAGGQG